MASPSFSRPSSCGSTSSPSRRPSAPTRSCTRIIHLHSTRVLDPNLALSPSSSYFKRVYCPLSLFLYAGDVSFWTVQDILDYYICCALELWGASCNVDSGECEYE